MKPRSNHLLVLFHLVPHWLLQYHFGHYGTMAFLSLKLIQFHIQTNIRLQKYIMTYYSRYREYSELSRLRVIISVSLILFWDWCCFDFWLDVIKKDLENITGFGPLHITVPWLDIRISRCGRQCANVKAPGAAVGHNSPTSSIHTAVTTNRSHTLPPSRHQQNLDVFVYLPSLML